jgi:hypothetical protein
MNKLVEAVALRKVIEAKIEEISAPIKAQLRDALGDLPDMLSRAKGIESLRRQSAEAAYAQAFDERQRLLREGVDVPPIPLPSQVSVTWVGELRGKATAELFELGLLEPRESEIKKRLASGVSVPGYELGKKPSLRIRLK